MWEGKIHDKAQGNIREFGYDLIFYLPELKKTAAELTIHEKNQLSHRAAAFKQFCLFLSNKKE